MPKRNMDIREAIRKSGITQWMVAERLGISEATFTRRLRMKLSDSDRKEIYKAIDEVRQLKISSLKK